MKPLDERHREAAAVLATGTAADAARAVGVAVRTVRTWNKREDFRALVTELRGREASHEPGALATLRELLKSEDESVRLRAAIALLNAGRGGADPADDDKAGEAAAAAGLVILDPSILEDDESEPVEWNLADLYDRWGGAEITQREADHWRTALDFGWLGVEPAR